VKTAKKEIQNNFFKDLSKKYSTPEKVQKLLRSFEYNTEKNGETCQSAYGVYKTQKCHCIEASFFAAAILEHQGYPPLVLSLESQDGLDHVLFLFKEKNCWGSVGRSRDEGLNGRAPIFKNIRSLVWSYFDPYIDKTGKITAYQIANLDDCEADWRFSRYNVWKAEGYLIDLKHRPLISSERRYEKIFNLFKENTPLPAESHWW
jgi:hypothetical protein